MIYDITPELTENYKVWPGSQSLIREMSSEIKKGDRTTSSVLKATVHLGAHADAPSHYIKDGETIGQRDLNYYLGPCQVIRVKIDKDEEIAFSHFKDPIVSERVLFATDSFTLGEPPESKFAAISSLLIDELHKRGVITIGIDTPSVDLFDSEELLSHAACGRNNISIIENLDLSLVPEGLYELIALPLRLKGFEASPLRAVLRTLRV